MRSKIAILVLVMLAFGWLVGCSSNTANTAEPAATAVSTPEATPTPEWLIEGWDLVWQEEFDGETLNLDNWTYEIGGHGWGNGEAQHYSDDPKNLYLEDGLLIIEALQENVSGKRYSSARITSAGKVEVEYGRIEARIKIPVGQGLWPAFWMLGNDLDKVGWPFAGEIDIMENVGHEPYTIHGTVHGPGYFGANGVGAAKRLTGGEQYADDFHIFAIEWEEDQIYWYMDDQLYAVLTPADVPGEWVYDHPFYIILNLAVGGEWPGYPDGTTAFPQSMKVDYVRIYEQSPVETENE